MYFENSYLSIDIYLDASFTVGRICTCLGVSVCVCVRETVYVSIAALSYSSVCIQIVFVRL